MAHTEYFLLRYLYPSSATFILCHLLFVCVYIMCIYLYNVCVLRHTHVTAIESVHIRGQLFRIGSLLQLWDLRVETQVFYILCHLTLCSALCLWFRM